jgi:hypothetical protein
VAFHHKTRLWVAWCESQRAIISEGRDG